MILQLLTLRAHLAHAKNLKREPEMHKATTPEHAAMSLRNRGATPEQIAHLRALPAVNWGLLVKFIEDHGGEIQQTIADFLAIFGK